MQPLASVAIKHCGSVVITALDCFVVDRGRLRTSVSLIVSHDKGPSDFPMYQFEAYSSGIFTNSVTLLPEPFQNTSKRVTRRLEQSTAQSNSPGLSN